MLMLILISNSSLIILFVSPVFSNLDFNFNYFVLSMALSLLNAFYLREREICFEEKEKKTRRGLINCLSLQLYVYWCKTNGRKIEL